MYFHASVDAFDVLRTLGIIAAIVWLNHPLLTFRIIWSIHIGARIEARYVPFDNFLT